LLIVCIHHCGNNFIISWKSWQTKNKNFNSYCILDIIWIIISYYDDPWKEDEIDSDKAKGRVYTMVWTRGYAKVKTGGFTKVRTGEYTKVFFFFFCSSQNLLVFCELVLKTWSLCFSIGLFLQAYEGRRCLIYSNLIGLVWTIFLFVILCLAMCTRYNITW
jgi:hypothetical protein